MRLREAQNYFRRAGVAGRIRMNQGDAVALLKKSMSTYDYIFCDVDKKQYPEALNAAVPRLRHGGLFVVDNVLWSGRVARPAKDAATRAIQHLNHLLYSSHDLFSAIVPLRDGVAFARKR